MSGTHLEEKFKDHCCVDILLGDRRQPQVGSDTQNTVPISQSVEIVTKNGIHYLLMWKKEVRAMLVTGERTWAQEHQPLETAKFSNFQEPTEKTIEEETTVHGELTR